MTDEIGGVSPTPADLEAAAAAVVMAEWGRHPSRVRRVSSDLEETFLVEFAAGPRGAIDRAVLKVAEPGRDPGWFAFEIAIVEEALHRDPGLPLARGVSTPDGRSIVSSAFLGEPRVARLMRHLAGRPSHLAHPDAAARRRIGRTAGRLSRALAPFEHPAATRRVPWDLRGLDALADALALVPDASARAAVQRALDAHPALLRAAAQLPAQISHNDLNGDNVLVSPDDPGEVTGIIDFGDAAYTPRIFDAAIAAAYAAVDASASRTDPGWTAAASVTLGYADEVALAPDELALVPGLARARLAQRVLIAAARRESADGTPTRDDEAWLTATQRDLLTLVEANPTDCVDAPKEWR